MSGAAELALGPRGETLGARPVALGAPLRLALRVEAGGARRFSAAALRLAAPPEGGAPFAAASRPSDEAGRWAMAELEGGERSVTSVKVGSAAAGGGAARIRLFAQGAWRPLPGPDALAFGQLVAIPATAASKAMAEFLAPLALAKGSETTTAPALVPTPLAKPLPTLDLAGPPSQPCHVEVALGDEPPFFALPGPLPQGEGVEAAGFLRALNRFLAENPSAETVPLRVAAGSAPGGQVVVAHLSATPEAKPAPGGSTDGAGGAKPAAPVLWPAQPERPTGTAQLLDASREAALPLPTPSAASPDSRFQAMRYAALPLPTPSAASLSGLRLRLRAALGSVPPPEGTVALHAGDAAGPAGKPLAEAALPPLPLSGEAALDCPFPAPVAPPPGAALWAVCRLARGEALWLLGPEGAAKLLVRPEGLGWRPRPGAGG